MQVRKLTKLQAEASCAQLNAFRLDMLRLAKKLILHASASDALDGYADADTFVDVTNAMGAGYTGHIESVCDSVTGVGAHFAADSVNVLVAADATDLATACTLANDVKSKANSHFIVTTCHPYADSVSITAPDATDLPSLQVLLLDMEDILNQHFAKAFTSEAIELIAP